MVHRFSTPSLASVVDVGVHTPTPVPVPTPTKQTTGTYPIASGKSRQPSNESGLCYSIKIEVEDEVVVMVELRRGASGSGSI